MIIALLERLRGKQASSQGNGAQIPGANIKEFLATILSEAKRQQIHLSEPRGCGVGAK